MPSSRQPSKKKSQAANRSNEREIKKCRQIIDTDTKSPGREIREPHAHQLGTFESRMGTTKHDGKASKEVGSAATEEEATDETNCEGPSLAPADVMASSPKIPAVLPKPPLSPTRSFEEELTYLSKLSPTRYQVKKGFVPNMKVDAEVIVNDDLELLLLEELKQSVGEGGGSGSGSRGGFIPALRQVANVAALPGIVKASMAMPDVHSGYGFCIGNVAAFDMDDPDAIISPGGVGFDINCGVRLIRTNLTEEDVTGDIRERLAQALFDHIPVGVGTKGVIPVTPKDLDEVLLLGIDWALREGYAWPEVSAARLIYQQ